jgi:hypothetical protein
MVWCHCEIYVLMLLLNCEIYVLILFWIVILFDGIKFNKYSYATTYILVYYHTSNKFNHYLFIKCCKIHTMQVFFLLLYLEND